ncbi:COX15/CtaA family protein [Neptunicella sp.]|uniref:COX15/CtaA family protein n=1 Tax=Neptunicella sp. TaxID=2125986 RepID=UPI003F68FA78
MKKMVLVSILLAYVVIILGAYTRLTDAGLGCPDWPGCYGHYTVPQQTEHLEAAQQAFPDHPVEPHKAWNEMIHRYFASTLGLFIVIIFLLSLFSKKPLRPIKLPFLLVLMVCFQGALGMWTVTLNLMPLVVMGHLLGGFSILACLYLLHLRLSGFRIPGGDPHVRRLARYTMFGLLIVITQIALGGWTSANYAALACTELPVCEPGWIDNLNFSGAFSLPIAETYEYGVHDYSARMTMHIMHRIGALITFVYLCWLAIKIYKVAHTERFRNQAILLVLVLGLQVALGVSNVVFGLPLIVAVLHNAIGASLLLVMVLINYTLFRKA